MESSSLVEPSEQEAFDAPSEGPLRELWKRLKSDRLAMIGLVVLFLLMLAAFAGKALTEWTLVLDPATVRLPDKFRPPMARAAGEALPEGSRPPFGRYWLGTDELGRDVLARMLQGSFVSLSIGFVGPVSVEGLVMRFTDIMLCFPTFFLILTVVALLPPSIYNIMIVIGLTSWMSTARFVRAEFFSLKEQDFVAAAKALGLPERRIIFRHMMPNALAPVLVSASIGVAGAILTESALSFLGFGVQPPYATWGNILADGKDFIFDAPWLFFIPGLSILLVVLAFNLVGEGLREALDPRLRGLR
jgi:peptide/nickel transport system permease protein